MLTPEETQRLSKLEAAFEVAGGRGVDLAEEIDALRAKRDEQYVLVQGNPIDGLTLTGPFADRDDAVSAGEDSNDGDWWIAPLVAGEAGDNE